MVRLIDSLPVGAYVKDLDTKVTIGENTAPIYWRIASHDHPNYGNNGTLLIADVAPDVFIFDGREPGNTNTTYVNYGNPNYHLSNVRQYLNSQLTDWFIKQHEYDGDASGYINAISAQINPQFNLKPGFLTNFSPNLLSKMMEMNYKTQTPLGTFDLSDKVILPHPYEVNGGGTASLTGAHLVRPYKLFEDGYKHFSRPNDFIRAYYYPSGTAGTMESAMTRSYDVNNFTYNTSAGTTVSNNPASYSYNIALRPVISVSKSTYVSDIPDTDGYYIIQEYDAPAISIRNYNFPKIFFEAIPANAPVKNINLALNGTQIFTQDNPTGILEVSLPADSLFNESNEIVFTVTDNNNAVGTRKFITERDYTSDSEYLFIGNTEEVGQVELRFDLQGSGSINTILGGAE